MAQAGVLPAPPRWSRPALRGASRRSERRIRAAAFPRGKSLRAFDFDADPNVDPVTANRFWTCEWVRKGEPLRLIGDSGTGSKSHLLIAPGAEPPTASSCP